MVTRRFWLEHSLWGVRIVTIPADTSPRARSARHWANTSDLPWLRAPSERAPRLSRVIRYDSVIRRCASRLLCILTPAESGCADDYRSFAARANARGCRPAPVTGSCNFSSGMADGMGGCLVRGRRLPGSNVLCLRDVGVNQW